MAYTRFLIMFNALKQHHAMFNSCAPCNEQPSYQLHVHMHAAGEGHAGAGANSATARTACASPSTQPGHTLQLLSSKQAVLESVLQAISKGWMCILVGPSGVGKTSVARTAAQLAGQQLTEIALTGGTDTADLLGGFEQMEPKRKVQVSSLRCACCAVHAVYALPARHASHAAT